ncbi:MAG: PadR family transcriptional regulator [Candidatus Bipolaricaulia bacterium]
MSLKHALLGFLSFGPATGYDLKNRMEQSVQYFWHADLSQIYRTLDAMRDAGWVDKAIEHQESRPPRHVYSIQDAGREELIRWLQEPLEQLPTVHNPFLLKVFFGGMLGADTAVEHLRRHRELHQGRLAFLYEVETTVPEQLRELDLSDHIPYILATLRLGRKMSETYIEWCDETIQALQEAERSWPVQEQGER